MAKTIINEVAIRAKVINNLRRQQYVGLARSAANTRFIAAKQNLLQDFDGHVVTKELLGSPNEYGKSELISRGNLIAFLGFEDASLRVGELRNYLENPNNIDMSDTPRISSDNRKIYYNFPVKVPSISQIYNDPLFETPDNWSSRSWIEIIEEGVGNAAYFVFRLIGFNNSRSFFGIQNKKKKQEESGGLQEEKLR